MTESIGQFASACALGALLYEAGVTPKPGLVDKCDCGSHRDMTFRLLEKSARVISPFIGLCAEKGYENASKHPSEVFPLLKEAGLEAENAMLRATSGVNTHKGSVFCLSLLSGAYGMLIGRGKKPSCEEIARFAGSISETRMRKELSDLKAPVTSGEKAFFFSKLSGARVQAMQGYPMLVHCALPALRYALFFGKNLNDACVYALMALISRLDDTCLYARGGTEGLEFAKSYCKKAISDTDIIKHAETLNTLFIKRTLSPGGSADLLAAAIFLMLITSEIREEEL